MPIVQQQDVPALEMTGEAVEHAPGTAVHGVETAPRPAHQLQIRSRERRLEERIAQAGWRPEEPGNLTSRRTDSLLCTGNLVRHAARAEEREAHEVPIGVITDLVLSCHDGARQLRVAFDALADAEKGGAR